MKHLKRFLIGLLVLPFYVLFATLYGIILILCIPISLVLMPLYWIYDLGKDIIG